MRVVAEKTFETYFELRMIEIVEGREIKGSLAAHLYRCGAPVRVTDPAGIEDPVFPVQEVPEVEDEVVEEPDPEGLDIDATAAVVLEWVGDSPTRAREAIDAESAKDRPRSTLLKRLDEIAG